MPIFTHLNLNTERLLLRPLCHDDAAAILRMRSKFSVMQYTSSPPWTDVAQAVAMIERDQAAMAKEDCLRLGLVRKSDQTFIGACILFHLDAACRRAEIGYELDDTYWGQGYMHEALTCLLNYGFHEMNLNRVEADIDPRNNNSARTLERLGFVKEGFLRERWIVDGIVSDTALYGLLRSDWLARQ